MPKLDREGVFKVAERAETYVHKANSGAVAIVLRFIITHKLEGSEWADWSHYDFYITSHQWIVQKDTTFNESTKKTLKENLGWDGVLASAADGRFQTPAVQVVVESKTWTGRDGQQRNDYQVKWINPIDSEGRGSQPASPEVLAELNRMYGSRLRAAFGKVASRSAEPAEVPPATPSEPDNSSGTREKAWAAFCKLQEDDAKVTDDVLGNEWTKVLAEMFPGKKQQNFTPEDWNKVEKEGPEMAVVPF